MTGLSHKAGTSPIQSKTQPKGRKDTASPREPRKHNQSQVHNQPLAKPNENQGCLKPKPNRDGTISTQQPTSKLRKKRTDPLPPSISVAGSLLIHQSTTSTRYKDIPLTHAIQLVSKLGSVPTLLIWIT